MELSGIGKGLIKAATTGDASGIGDELQRALGEAAEGHAEMSRGMGRPDLARQHEQFGEVLGGLSGSDLGEKLKRAGIGRGFRL